MAGHDVVCAAWKVLLAELDRGSRMLTHGMQRYATSLSSS